MCENCAASPSRQHHDRRRKIWETNAARHCSIIGTCLTLREIRALARKLGYASDKNSKTDFLLHGHFVREAGTKSLTAKLLNKLLDSKYSVAIKQFQKIRTADELETAWNEAYQDGDIPGPYWAILSHPQLCESLALHIYGQVHMLSHLAGASNRSDRADLKRLEQEIAPLEERLKKETLRHRRLAEEKEQTIIDLRCEVVTLKSQLTGKTASSLSRAENNPGKEYHKHETDRLKLYLAQLKADNHDLDAKFSRLSEILPLLKAEIHALENALESENTPASDQKCPYDLGGCKILYVGGQTSQICRLRALIAGWNGDLLHHDGGQEQSLGELASAIGKADTVVFPTDCVSHNAAMKVKRLCRQTMKPFIPLRTSGTASFVAGLRDQLQDMTPLPKSH